MHATVYAKASIALVSVREYVQHEPYWVAVNVVLIVASAAIGTFVFNGWPSFVFSLLAAVLGFFVGARATRYIIERERMGRVR